MGQEGAPEWHQEGRVLRIPFETATLFVITMAPEWQKKENFGAVAKSYSDWLTFIRQHGPGIVGPSARKLFGIEEILASQILQLVAEKFATEMGIIEASI